MGNKFSAKWTGEYPNLCHGEWILKYNDTQIIFDEEDEQKTTHFNTKKEYSSWHFDDNFEECWESEIDGLNFEEWFDEFKPWLKKLFNQNSVPFSKESAFAFYEAVNKEDWRYESCGGCI